VILRRGASLLPLLLASAPLLGGQRVPPVASYTIEASLDREHGLSGKESVTFVNRTRSRAEELRFHLYLNAFRNERSTWLKETAGRSARGPLPKAREERFGWVEANRIATADGTDLTPGMRYESPDDGNPDDRTVLVVPLASPVEPGQTARFEIDFSGKLPRVVARTGWKDDFVMGAQWFPKLGVLTDAGWNCHQFHGPTEFFSDFGDYDVTLTLPGEMKGKIGATGALVEEAEIAGGLVRARFVATDVHDFAFTACARYEVYRDVFSRKGFPNVTLLLLLQPDHRAVKERYFRAAKEGLAHYGEWFVPYPYPTLTIVDPPWGSGAGGMEYPTLFTAGARWLSPKDVLSPEGLTVHEFGHQIFYGLLASNEFEEAHLDEGFTSYATARTMHEAWGDPPLERRFFGIPFVFGSVRVPIEADGDAYRSWQLSTRSDSASQVSFRTLDSAATRANAYSKTALVLASCERTLGAEVWGRVLKTYATRFAFRHPTARDFRGVLKEVAGEQADDLLKETWDSTGTVDYAVAQAATAKALPPAGFFGDGPALKYRPAGKQGSRWESVVVVRRMGEAVWPTDVALRFEGGHEVRRTWDGRARWIRYRITGPKLLSAEVDPDRKDLLDVNVLNNGMTAEPRPRAANVWGVKLRFFAQNLLEFFCALAVVRW
jgi:hypothetical protein